MKNDRPTTADIDGVYVFTREPRIDYYTPVSSVFYERRRIFYATSCYAHFAFHVKMRKIKAAISRLKLHHTRNMYVSDIYVRIFNVCIYVFHVPKNLNTKLITMSTIKNACKCFFFSFL